MKPPPECYGLMFPDFTKLKRKEKLEGQAFAAMVVPCLPLPSIEVDASAAETPARMPKIPESGSLSMNQVEDGSGGPA